MSLIASPSLLRRHLLAALSLSVMAPMSALAQPDLSRKLGPTIADTGSAAYRFARVDLRSADGRRGYRVVLGIPNQAAPAAGYPAIVLLDGNAALAAMDEALLQSLQAGQAPLLVAVGYDTELRFDVAARAFDYTPPLPPGTPDEENQRGRQGGGADVFLALLQDQILPRVRAAAPVDATRMTLWGHSYGGLFALHTLFTRPALFSRYIAASPSLWWGRGVILQEEQAFLGAAPGARPQLWIMTGSDEGRARGADANASTNATIQAAVAARASAPPQAMAEMVGRLRNQAAMEVDWRVFQGMAHGPMLPASLVPALRIAAGLAPF